MQAGVGRKFQTPSIYEDLTVFENLEISYPRGRTVFGALTFQRDAAVQRPGRGGRRDDLPEGPARHLMPTCSATARSNGSRSACC